MSITHPSTHSSISVFIYVLTYPSFIHPSVHPTSISSIIHPPFFPGIYIHPLPTHPSISTHPPTYSSICPSSIHLFFQLLIYSYSHVIICSLILLFIYSSAHPPIQPPIHLTTQFSIYPSAYPSTHSPSYPSIQPFFHSPIYPSICPIIDNACTCPPIHRRGHKADCTCLGAG